ncbi:MAG: DUF456 domain-containing protein [Verrucomicrobia bacterium]|nr:DUF456 domain-containing protein [Verrucomicrobiota bacterium]MBV9657801.1 DUF456 domain-containing protein [Verrucomicrobiota bacterium]
MEAVWWTLSVLLMLAGLVGAVFPVLPDSLLILAGAVLHHFTVPPERSVGWWTLGVLAVLTVLAHVADFVAGALGARKFGASRWGAFGGFIGAIVGLFFFPWGLFLGPVLGVLCAEVLFARRTLAPAAKSSAGTLLGTLAGMAAKITIDFLMVAIFAVAVLWRH